MSKLYNKYLELKSYDYTTLYLFKSGIFYIFLSDDAKKVSSLLGLKLTLLNSTIAKCGFPISAADKYFGMLNNSGYSFKIIDLSSNNSCNIKNKEINILLNKLTSINTNNLSIKEAYSFIDDMKELANSIKL